MINIDANHASIGFFRKASGNPDEVGFGGDVVVGKTLDVAEDAAVGGSLTAGGDLTATNAIASVLKADSLKTKSGDDFFKIISITSPTITPTGGSLTAGGDLTATNAIASVLKADSLKTKSGDDFFKIISITSPTITPTGTWQVGKATIPYTIPEGYKAVWPINICSIGDVSPSYINTNEACFNNTSGFIECWWTNPYTIPEGYKAVWPINICSIGDVSPSYINTNEACFNNTSGFIECWWTNVTAKPFTLKVDILIVKEG